MILKAEVNLKTIKANIAKLRTKLGQNVKVCAVLKNNANRQGDAKIAIGIEDATDYFASAHIYEAMRIKKAGIKKPVLLVGPCPDFRSAIEHDIEISLNHLTETKSLAAFTQENELTVKVHIKVNTGLNRYGIQTMEELKEILEVIQVNPQIQVVGLYTHGGSEEVAELNKLVKHFTPFVDHMRGLYPDIIVHAAASGAVGGMLALTAMHFDMVRVGRLLYGATEGYETTITVTSQIMDIQHVKKDEAIGYGGSELATKDSVIGLVPGGYGDVTPIQFSKVVHVLVDGKPCKIMGYVNTDSFMIDVTGIKNPLYKTVTIISPDKGQTWLDHVKTSGISTAVIIAIMNYDRAEVSYKS